MSVSKDNAPPPAPVEAELLPPEPLVALLLADDASPAAPLVAAALVEGSTASSPQAAPSAHAIPIPSHDHPSFTIASPRAPFYQRSGPSTSHRWQSTSGVRSGLVGLGRLGPGQRGDEE